MNLLFVYVSNIRKKNKNKYLAMVKNTQLESHRGQPFCFYVFCLSAVRLLFRQRYIKVPYGKS